MSDAQRPLQLQDRRSQGCTGLRQPEDLSGQGRGRQGPDQIWMTQAAGMLIVGAGECGARAAFALREAGYAGPVTLIGAEDRLPYERPPLSKGVLQADVAPE